MRILGIDPGTQVVGFGCLEVREGTAPAGPVPVALRARRLSQPPEAKNTASNPSWINDFKENSLPSAF